MRNIWIIACVVVVLAAAGAGVYFYMRSAQGGDHTSNHPNRAATGPKVDELAKLLPDDTVFLMHWPDPAGTGESYQKSKLKKIADEPQLTPFIAKVREGMGKDFARDMHVPPETFDKLLGAVRAAASGESFIALLNMVELNKTEGNIHYLGARPARFLVGAKGADWAALKAAIQTAFKKAELKSASVGGLAYEYFNTPGLQEEPSGEKPTGEEPGGEKPKRADLNDPKTRVCIAMINGWLVAASGEKTLLEFSERAQGKPGAALAQKEAFVSARKNMDSDADYYVFFDGASLKEFTDTHANDFSINDNPMATAYLASQKVLRSLFSTLSYTTTISESDGLIHNRIFIAAPKDGPSARLLKPLSSDALKYTSPQTVAYVSVGLDTKGVADFVREQLGKLLEGLNKEQPAKFNPDDYIGAVGGEVSVVVDWPEGAMMPEVGIFLSMSEPEKLEKLMEPIRTMLLARPNAKEFDVGEFHLVTGDATPNSNSPLFATKGKFFAAFNSIETAQHMLARNGETPLTANAGFKSAGTPSLEKASLFIYIDTPQILKRAWPMMGAGMTRQLQRDGLTWPADSAFLEHTTGFTMLGKATEGGYEVKSASGIGDPYMLIVGVSALKPLFTIILGGFEQQMRVLQ